MLASLLLTISATTASSDTTMTDSVNSGPVQRVDVIARRAAIPPGRSRMAASVVEDADAIGLDRILRGLPGSLVAVNSRGEAVMSLRGGSERQTGVFLDGAPLALPWDQRIDLSLLPGAVVGSVEVDQGASTLLHGPWASGGVVNLLPRRRATPGTEATLSAQTGSLGARSGQVQVLGNTGNLVHSSSAGTASREGRPVPDLSRAEEPSLLKLHQASSQTRTNTDRRNAWFSSSLEKSLPDEARIGVSILALDGTKGEAPSGMEGDKARFWRYPDWRLLRASAWGGAQVGRVDLDSWGWLTLQDQTIDQYRSVDFSTKEASELGADQVWGARTAATTETPLSLGNLKGTISVQGQWTRHDQRTDAYDSTGIRRSGTELRFEQWQSSVGTELVWNPQPFTLTIAGSFEGTGTPETGDKPAYEDRYEPGAAVTADYAFTRELRTWISAGTRTRVPSLRELYGEALKKFAPNPDLRSETFRTIEMGGSIAVEGLRGQVVVFHRLEQDRIDQQTLPDKRNRRINLDDTRFQGVEGQTSLAAAGLRLDTKLLWLDAETDDDRYPEGKIPRVADWNTSVNLGTAPWHGVEPSVEWTFVGESWDHANNALVRLPASHLWNTRIGWTPPRRNSSPSLELFVRLDNVLDTPHFPQMGLVGDGRTWSTGLDVSL